MNSSSEKPGAARFLVEYEPGAQIFAQGERGSDMFIVHEGQVEILQESAGEPAQLATLEKGDFFGEMSLLEELPRLASARALTAVKLVRIDSAAFDKLLRRDPEIAIRIMRKLSRRLRETDEQLRSLIDAAEPARRPRERTGVSHSLRHLASRARFPLKSAGETRIGRGDPVTGQQPDIDLTPVDPDRSSSRRHAKLYFEDGSYHVVEEIGTINGTFVNGVRLEAGQPLRVAAGDELRFGLVELVLADDSADR